MATVYLRALESSDLDNTHRWHNDRELFESLVGSYRFVSRDAEEKWLRNLTEYSEHQVNLAICVKESSTHIGNLYLKDINWIARRAELHIFIGDREHRGKGYGQSAVRLVIDHAFGDLGLLRLFLQVLENNHAAVRVYEKCGFRLEGKLIKHAYKDGRFCDVLLMGLCAADLADDANEK